jgi:hypothetical protein
VVFLRVVFHAWVPRRKIKKHRKKGAAKKEIRKLKINETTTERYRENGMENYLKKKSDLVKAVWRSL